MQLRALGAEVLHLPLLSFVEPEDPEPLRQALRQLDSFDWLLFTSQNAVRFVLEQCRKMNMRIPSAENRKLRVAAVGKATAEAATQEGVRVDHVASRSQGVALAEELRPLTGKRVLLPRSDRGRPDLPHALRSAGAEVTEAVAYRTVPTGPENQQALDEICRGAIDVITLASPSALHSLSEVVGIEAVRSIVHRTLLATIGPTTAAAIRESGLPVGVEASEASASGLARAIAAFYAQRSEGVSTR